MKLLQHLMLFKTVEEGERNILEAEHITKYNRTDMHLPSLKADVLEIKEKVRQMKIEQNHIKKPLIMKTYKVTYQPITGDLRTLDKLSLFDLAALLERLQYSSYVSQETVIITTEGKP